MIIIVTVRYCGYSITFMGLRLAVYGFGEIGRLLARVAIKRGHEVVGAIDIDPMLLGRDVGELIGEDRIGVRVTSNVEEALKECDLVLHATGSYLHMVYDQICEVLRFGKSIVSTCETLAYPFYRYPVLARRLDKLARTRGATVIGAGINPGFLLDSLAIIISASVPRVVEVRAKRSLNALARRESFRRKIGLGLDPGEFESGLRSGRYSGHVGYAESVCLIADAAGLNLTKIIEMQEPLIAEEAIRCGDHVIEKGRVRGIRGYGIGYADDVERIRIEFEAAAGSSDYEEIVIRGEEYSITWRSSGTPGDLGTASVILSIAERVEEFPYGLLTMSDILPYGIGFGGRAKL